MFLIGDFEGRTSFKHRCNDVDTAADVLYGLTGCYEDYTRAKFILGNMLFEDTFVTRGYYIRCVPERDT